MTYKEPPMKFNVGTKKFEVDLPLKKERSTKPISTDLTKKGIIIFLACLIVMIVTLLFIIRFFV